MPKWQAEQRELSLNEACTRWLHVVEKAATQAVPTKGVSGGAKPWWSPRLEKLAKRKDGLRRRYQETGNEELKKQYREAQNEFDRVSDEQKEKTWRKKCEEMDSEELATNELMRLYRRTHDKQSKKPITLSHNGTEAVTTKEKVELLGDFYSKVGKNTGESYGEIRRWQDQVEREFEEEHMETERSAVEEFQSMISKEEVQWVVKQLVARKAPGPDGVAPPLVIQGGEVMIESLLTLYRRTWAEGHLPPQWKEANICPIPKVTAASTCGKFRPISLLSVVSKLMERIVARRLYRYVERENVLPEYQSGFRQGHSTVNLLAELQQEAHSAFARRESLLFVMLDIEKAYDRAWRPGIMRRLRDIGVDGRMLVWIRDFLGERRARVVLDGQKSEWRPSEYGVPQGSPLSPLLFNIFVAPVLRRVKTGKLMFADDIGLFLRGKNMRALSRRMTRELAWVSLWAHKWKAKFNLGKCIALALSRNRPTPIPSVRFDGKTLKVPRTDADLVEHAKYLGVVLDCVASALTYNQEEGNEAAPFPT